MSDSPFDEFEKRARRPRRNKQPGVLWKVVVILAMFCGFAWTSYNMFRIEVGTGEMAILIHKTGIDITNDMEVAPDATYKGVQREYLTEGRYFRNPYNWDWDVIPQTVIAQGKMGVLVSLTGDDPEYGQFLAKIDPSKEKILEPGAVLSKGIVPTVLRPGRYPINPFLFTIEDHHQPITVRAGYKGVVTNLAGKLPQDPNQLLVNEGERGVQKETLNPGTYYVNPYMTRITSVNCRKQRFDLAEKKDMGFPSKDGFWVRLEGVIQFQVNPEKVAEVYVTYNDEDNGDRIDEEIINKIIMPNARSFCRLEGSNNLGREFIQGGPREEFKKKFEAAMQNNCAPLGITIIEVSITKIHPPQQIAGPVRDRAIAKQQELQFQQQILQQESEKDLAIEQTMVLQKQALVVADQKVVKVVTEAKQEQEVAVTKANERMGVAQFRLDAAQDEADAIQARGKAEAEVIRFQNEAEAAGWKESVKAFSGQGLLYAQFVMYQKLASAYQRIMVNTADSPIMKVFESFSPENVHAAQSVTAPAAASSSTEMPAVKKPDSKPDEKPATPSAGNSASNKAK